MSEKTEQPTPQRLRKARQDGQVARSKDMTQTVLIVSLFGYLLSTATETAETLGSMMLMPAGVLQMDFEAAVNAVATQLLLEGLKLLSPYVGIVIFVGLGVEFAQTGGLFAWKAMAPSAKKLNVVANVKNIFGAKNLFEFLKSTLKIVLLSALVTMLLTDALPTLMTLPTGGITAVGVATGMLLKSMILWVSGAYFVLSAFDLFWQRRQHIKQLMMTKDEVFREYKENEGDPHIKHRRRELHQEMLEDGELQATRHASAVVTNPTHLAIAIAYQPGVTALPVVLAKGEGAHAKRIVAVARQHGIAVVQNIPVARSLMAHANLNHYIPVDLIEPVAELLRLVRELKESEDPLGPP